MEIRVSLDMDNVQYQLKKMATAREKCERLIGILEQGESGKNTSGWKSTSAEAYRKKCGEMKKELKGICDEINNLEILIRNTAEDIIRSDRERAEKNRELLKTAGEFFKNLDQLVMKN